MSLPTRFCLLVLLVWLLCLVCFGSRGQGLTRARQQANRTCTLQWSASKLNVRELTGRNDGAEVEAFLKVTGNRKGEAWCGAFQAAGQRACGLPMPTAAGGARYWFVSPARTYYVRGSRGVLDSLKPADKVAFYYVNLGRIGHIGNIVSATRAVRRGRPARGYIIRAGNTGTGGGRDGAGVHDIFYAATDIYAAANWNY